MARWVAACNGCHGPEGWGSGATAELRGQSAEAIATKLQQWRNDPEAAAASGHVMARFAAILSLKRYERWRTTTEQRSESPPIPYRGRSRDPRRFEPGQVATRRRVIPGDPCLRAGTGRGLCRRKPSLGAEALGP